MSPRFLKHFKPRGANKPVLTDVSAELELARSLDQQGRSAEATSICEGILKRQPDNIDSLILLAEFAGKKEDPEQAIELYSRVIALRPEHALACYKLGNLLKNCDRMEAALASYDQAIALNPGYANAFCNRGVVLDRLKRSEEALASYDEAI